MKISGVKAERLEVGSATESELSYEMLFSCAHTFANGAEFSFNRCLAIVRL